MIVVVVVLAVLAVALLAWGVVSSRKLGTASGRIGELEGKLADTTTRAEIAGQAAAEASTRAEAEGRRADEAERASLEATSRADASDDARVEAEAHAEVADLERQKAVTSLGLLRPEGLWALEKQRVERLWRDRLALLPEDISPLADGSDQGAAAVSVFAEASREESGVVIDVTWLVEKPLDPALAVVLVRLAEELIAAARRSDGGELEVHAVTDDDGGDVVLFRLRTDPPVDAPEDLVAACEGSGWTISDADDLIEVRVPVGAAEPVAAAEPARPAGPAGPAESTEAAESAAPAASADAPGEAAARPG